MDNLYDTIDKSILKSLPNPAKGAYEVKIKIPEFTFLGVCKQPDFATVYLTFYPQDKIIELKSLKEYSFCPFLYADFLSIPLKETDIEWVLLYVNLIEP